jgi:glutamate synthase (ferredoxin)
MLDFVEHLAAESGLPVGIKSAVGMEQFWVDLADAMERGDRGVDFITIDGGEGGTGAAPPAFADHVALPFKVGFSRVYRIFAERGLQDRIVFIGSGRLGLPEVALFSFALGCDMINVAREAMLSIGCIQAQRCHTNHCPAGVATQNKWLSHGLDPTLKSVRCANYLVTLREIVMELTRACGAPHPALIGPDHFDILDDHFGTRSARDVFNYEAGWGMPSQIHQDAIREIMASSLKD